MGYRVLEHTADIALELDSPDRTGLLAAAAEAFRDLTLDPERLAPHHVERPLALVADDLGDLLVRWLEELLFRWDAHGEMVCELTSLHVAENTLQARLRFARLLPDAVPRLDIKAITYHDLSVREGPTGWTARVLLDV